MFNLSMKQGIIRQHFTPEISVTLLFQRCGSLDKLSSNVLTETIGRKLALVD